MSDLSYFVPGYGISRHIMFHHLRSYLGPNYKSYQYRSREGFSTATPQVLTRVNDEFFQRAEEEASLAVLKQQRELERADGYDPGNSVRQTTSRSVRMRPDSQAVIESRCSSVLLSCAS